MKKFYSTPTTKIVVVKLQSIIAGTNYLDNGENGDAGAKQSDSLIQIIESSSEKVEE